MESVSNLLLPHQRTRIRVVHQARLYVKRYDSVCILMFPFFFQVNPRAPLLSTSQAGSLTISDPEDELRTTPATTPDLKSPTNKYLNTTVRMSYPYRPLLTLLFRYTRDMRTTPPRPTRRQIVSLSYILYISMRVNDTWLFSSQTPCETYITLSIISTDAVGQG